MNYIQITADCTAGKLLTIYVLAYENAACVSKFLDSLLPIVFDDVVVVVADNSDRTKQVSETVQRYTDAHIGIVYISYGLNIELSTAVRPFEIVKSRYLWMVGACNLFRNDCLSVLRPILLEDHPDILLHFENELYRRTEIDEQRTYDDFHTIMCDHSYSVLCSINSLVYEVEKMRPFVRFGYASMSSMVPHTGMVYAAMTRGSVTIKYYPIKIFERMPRVQVWSQRNLIERLHTVLPFDADEKERKRFFATTEISDPWISCNAKSMSLSGRNVIPWKWRLWTDGVRPCIRSILGSVYKIAGVIKPLVPAPLWRAGKTLWRTITRD